MTTAKLDTAKEVYGKAVQLYEKACLSDQTKLSRLEGMHRIDDVLSAVDAAKKSYELRAKNSKVRNHLAQFSAHLVYYGQILDVLSQHHPEWVSLGWGTMKFMFILVMNHEEMITELAQAMSEIADVLPCVEIQLEVFNAENTLRTAVEELYAQIINFLLRTLEWYEKGRIKHALAALAAPFKLRFEDFKNRINGHARRVDRIANTLAQAKLAQMHLQLEKLLEARKDSEVVAKTSAESLKRLEFMMKEMATRMTQYHSESVHHLSSTGQDTKQIQVAMMLSVTKNTPLESPLESLRYCQAVCSNIRKQKRQDYSHLAPAFQAWAEAPKSSFIVVEGSTPTRQQTKNLATELVGLLKEAGKPTVWALKGRKSLEPTEEGSVHLLKHLCSQILQVNSEEAIRQVSSNLNAARVESAVTESDWLQILQESLKGLPELFIIVDLELLFPASSDISQCLLFLRILEELLNNNEGVPIRLAVFTFRRPLLTALRSDSTGAKIVPLKKRAAAGGSSQKGRQRNTLTILPKNGGGKRR